MGLRLRLNLLLACIFGVALVAALSYQLVNARAAVVAELNASTRFASALIEGLHGAEDGTVAEDSMRQLLDRLDRLAPLRHLRISTPLRRDDAVSAPRSASEPVPPRWFYRLLEPAPEVLERTLESSRGPIRMVADPSAEIAEAWRELRVSLVILVATFVGAMGVVVLSVGRILKPLLTLSAALEGVERGRYGARLDNSGIADVDRLNQRFNEMSAALARSERDKLALARRSLAIQEQERRHLAHELHDEMGQSITAIKALAVSIGERADRVIAERAATIVEVSSSIYERVRQMMRRLHPVALDELGLVAALRSMIDEWNTHHGAVFCRFVCAERAIELNSEARIGIYRIVQEALTNVARHAEASEVRVELGRGAEAANGSRLSLRIVDNGRGFDARDSAGGLGLRGIRERVEALGGEISIDSTAQHGVSIALSVPLKASAREVA